jgi:DmsE family decaheme c-type cytochrome
MTIKRFHRAGLRLAITVSAACLALVLWNTAMAREEAPAAEGYIGMDACAACHEDQATDFSGNVHANVPSSWGITGCEACHGPGQEHAEGGGDVSKIRRFGQIKDKTASEACLKCHEKGDHALFMGGSHDSRGVGCARCHSVHTPKRETALLKEKTEFDLCTSCHLKKKAALMRSSHMPMREGSMTCSVCHNMHGGIGPSNLRQASVNENCYSCHTEKRAPMLWEHPPVKESCLNCHDPHGSLHSSLLVAKRPRLCQQCHDEARHPTQPYGSADNSPFTPGNRLFNESCLNCHSQVHGSNHPAGVRFHR